MHNFTEISMILAIGALIAFVMRLLKQPLIIGHILTGIIVGPSVLGAVQSPENIEAFASFGIALLLFIVGLGLNPKIVKEVGKVAIFTGVGQVLFTTLFAYVIAKAIGYGGTETLFIAVAMAFSSTIIVLKLLSDKKEQNKLYGKISIGFLLVQDIIATFALLLASAAGQGGLSLDKLLILGIKGTAFVASVFLISRYVWQPMTSFLSRTQELLFLFAIAWGFGIAAVAHELGFSLEVGALIAGIALASMPYAQEVGSRLRPLRDFFIIVFFISLGAKLNIDSAAEVIAPAMVLSALVLIGNPIIVMTIMGLLGYTKKTSFKAGLAVAQISEFSLIFLLLGQRNGQVSESVVSLVTIVAITTIAISSYMIIYADGLFRYLEKYLQLFERRKVKYEQESSGNYEAVLFGYQRGGSEFVKVFQGITKRFVVIDYDPDVIDQLERKQLPFLYGDVTDPELLDEIDIEKSRLVVSNITDHESNVYLLRFIEKSNPKTVVICHANTVLEAEELYALGASYVMMPNYIGSEKISSFIKKSGLKKSEFKQYREKHLSYLHSHLREAVEAQNN